MVDISEIFFSHILNENITNIKFYNDDVEYDCNNKTELMNIYRLAILMKNEIERYARQLQVKNIEIDLNILAKDEGKYFFNCQEVFDKLYELDKFKIK